MAGKKHSDVLREKVIASLNSRRTVAEVAREFGLPYTTVMAWNNNIGKPARKPYVRGERGQPHPKKAEAIRRIEQGEGKSNVADDLGVSRGTVSVWTKHIPDKRKISSELNQELIERVRRGESISTACRALGISNSHAESILKDLDITLTKSQQQAIFEARRNGRKISEIAASLNVPQRAVYKVSGVKKISHIQKMKNRKQLD